MDAITQMFVTDVCFDIPGVVDCGKRNHWGDHQFPEKSQQYAWGSEMGILDYGNRRLPIGIAKRLPSSHSNAKWRNLILVGKWLDIWAMELQEGTVDWRGQHPKDFLLTALRASSCWVFVFAVDCDDIAATFESSPDNCVEHLILNLRKTPDYDGFLAYNSK